MQNHKILHFLWKISKMSINRSGEIRLFADDCVCYREIKNEEDTLKLQRDIDRLGSWARKWGMRFQPVKCNMMQLTNKRSSKIQANYTRESTVLEHVIYLLIPSRSISDHHLRCGVGG